MKDSPISLYVHIPFCASLCHYCDFAKTANYGADHIHQYFEVLRKQIRAWSQVLGPGQRFSSVFFGGGTPGLFVKEYDRLMNVILQRTHPGAEITIEANPDNVTVENVAIWKQQGFNRLSIGVQTFDPAGLTDLTRHHDARSALVAIDLAVNNFPKANADLIYGWRGQETKSWMQDLDTLVRTCVGHVSLYALTYEGQTPFARAERRGMRKQLSGDELALYYDVACEKLSKSGFIHEEVSNWSLSRHSCDHNWIYWRGHNYVGVGAGAHGFVDDGSAFGIRYSYSNDFRTVIRDAQDLERVENISDLLNKTAANVDSKRDLEAWKLEYVGSAIRSSYGIDLDLLRQKGLTLKPNPMVDRGFKEGLLRREDSRLVLLEKEWFRETAWAFEICRSINPVL